MDVMVNIEKVDTKKYQINVTIDEADLKAWATNYVSDQGHDFKIENGLKVWNVCDEDDNEITEIDEAGENWHHEYVKEYLDAQDADVLMLDNCHDFDKYELINEESSIIGIRGDL